MINLERKTLRCLLNRSIDLFQYRPCLSFVGETPITYIELGQRVKHLSNVLKENGISKGDKVAILGENSPNWGIAYFAITTLGAIAVPILPNFHTSEVHHIIRTSDVKILFCSKKLSHKAEEPQLGELQKIIYLDQFEVKSTLYKTDFLNEIFKQSSKDFYKLKDVARNLFKPSEVNIDENDVAVIIYTSGTTGHSKGVMLTHNNLISNLISISKISSVGPNDRFLSILPLSHTYECMIGFLTPLTFGSSIFYLQQPPTAKSLLPAFKKVKPTFMASVPLIMEKIYKQKVLGEIKSKKILRSLCKTAFGRKKIFKLAGKKLYNLFGGELRLILFGGAPLGAEVEKFLIESKFPYACGYGLTETSPLLAGILENVRFQSPGPCVPEVEIKIVNPDPETKTGDIFARGPNIMKGYFNDPEKTAEVLSEDGWFETGDRGYFDKDGYLFIKGRSKNLILGPSGENIYPEELEARLNESEYVLESLVFEKNKKVAARVHLDYEIIDKECSIKKLSETQIHRKISSLLENLKKETNLKVAAYSRIYEIIEQQEPFEKTPTQKIKRFLYVE